MARSDETKQPAQVPGDAESLPKGECDPVIDKAGGHSDPTEPVQIANKGSGNGRGSGA